MIPIKDIESLEALYAKVAPLSLEKVTPVITPKYRTWIEASRFAILSTVGPEGVDGSPRGDDGAVTKVADERTLHLPDWRGNNRLDSLRNIVLDGRVSVMFMVPGSDNVVRVNGHAILTADEEIRAKFRKGETDPATVVVITISEIYFQCAKAIMRSRLWASGEVAAEVPSAGDFLRECKEGFDGAAYDSGYGAYAASRYW